MQILPGKAFYQSGQALLVILLTMAVGLTVVLSVASRSVTEISVTTYEEDALRAFSAAEAGVEEALVTSSGASGTLPNAATFDAVIAGSDPKEFIYPAELLSGETATFWLVSQDTSGDLTCSGKPCFSGKSVEVCWGNPGSPIPAIEMSAFYDDSPSKTEAVNNGDFSQVKVARSAYDRNDVRRISNNFSKVKGGGKCTVLGQTFEYNTQKVKIKSLCEDTIGCFLMVRVRMFYNDTTPHPVGIVVKTSGTGELPPQGIGVESTGVAGDATRKVNVYRSLPEPGPLFDAAVFSLGDITKP